MTSWMIEALGEARRGSASNVIGEHLLSDIGFKPSPRPAEFDFTTNSFALAAHNLLDDRERVGDLREAAEMAFEALRASELPANPETEALHLLHTACYGVLGDRTPDVRRYLVGHLLPDLIEDEGDWGSRVRNGVYRLWLLLVRKSGWPDLDAVENEVVALRQAQKDAEADFLERSERPRVDAWHLIASYHLSKAAELLAIYSSQGTVVEASTSGSSLKLSSTVLSSHASGPSS